MLTNILLDTPCHSNSPNSLIINTLRLKMWRGGPIIAPLAIAKSVADCLSTTYKKNGWQGSRSNQAGNIGAPRNRRRYKYTMT